jgi:hypothetical protein
MNIPDDLSITKSEYIDNYIIRLSFSDGKINEVDFGVYLYRHPHPQYDKYRNLSRFKKYRIENGDIYWGKNGDLIFPIENLYFNNLEQNYEFL